VFALHNQSTIATPARYVADARALRAVQEMSSRCNKDLRALAPDRVRARQSGIRSRMAAAARRGSAVWHQTAVCALFRPRTPLHRCRDRDLRLEIASTWNCP